MDRIQSSIHDWPSIDSLNANTGCNDVIYQSCQEFISDLNDSSPTTALGPQDGLSL